jgi:hypothetical protein
MSHTFLLREGFWVAKGEYYDENGNVYSAVGQSETTHQHDVWVDERIIKVIFDKSVAITSRFEIESFGIGRRTIFRDRMVADCRGRNLSYSEDLARRR